MQQRQRINDTVVEMTGLMSRTQLEPCYHNRGGGGGHNKGGGGVITGGGGGLIVGALMQTC